MDALKAPLPTPNSSFFGGELPKAEFPKFRVLGFLKLGCEAPKRPPVGGGGPAGVEEGPKAMSGGGPAGVVEGALKLRLERREEGVEGGEDDDGTRNMAVIYCVVGRLKVKTENGEWKEQLMLSRVAAPMFSRRAISLEGVGKEVQDPSCAINKHKTSELQLHDAPEELLGLQRNNHPRHIRRNPFPLAPMLAHT
jgi:hypothetical protein